MSRLKFSFLSACGLLACASLSGAAPTYTLDFESDTLGAHPANWYGGAEPANTSTVVVDDTTSPANPIGPAGNKSLVISDASAAGDAHITLATGHLTTGGDADPVNLAANAIPQGTLTFNFNLTQSGFLWEFKEAGSLGMYIYKESTSAPMKVYNGVTSLTFDGDFSAPGFYNTTHTMEISFDFATDTFSAKLDNAQLTSGGGTITSFGFAEPMSRGLSLLFFEGAYYGPGETSNAFYDNFVLAPVPEPAALSLLGLGALAMLRRRK